MKVSITGKGVFLDGLKIDNVIRADVINLNPLEDSEVVLHVSASVVEVDHRNLGVKE